MVKSEVLEMAERIEKMQDMFVGTQKTLVEINERLERMESGSVASSENLKKKKSFSGSKKSRKSNKS